MMNSWIVCLGLTVCLISPAVAQQAVPALDDLISEVKKNEALYTDLQMKWEETVELLSPVDTFSNTTKFSRRTGTYTVKGEKFRSDSHDETLRRSSRRVDGIQVVEQAWHDTGYGYDGVQTRAFSDLFQDETESKFGNIGPGHIRKLAVIHEPHGTLLGMDLYSGGLSYWLEQWKQDPNYSITIDGFEEKSDEQCVKFTVRHFGENNVPADKPRQVRSTRKFWLAINRNYQDFAFEMHDALYSETVPLLMGEVYSFREIRKGVFLPDLIITEHSDDAIAKKEQRRFVEYRRTYKVNECILEPKVPENFFSDIVFPIGTKVTILDENRKRVKQYIQEEEQ